MGIRRFSGKPVPPEMQARVQQVVEAMIGRTTQPIRVTWSPSIVYAAARVSTGLNRMGTRLTDPKMEVSSKAWPLLTPEEQDVTLVHEAGHVAASLLGYVAEHHGPRWRKLMRDYGATPDRCLGTEATKRILQAFPRKRRGVRARASYNDIFGGLFNLPAYKLK